ncbi:MAG TPA: DUF2848 domain-containing protein [Burkholderiales bacterium]|nr:DUF2848 domain-containing protein [Burkholderiales bacterium]
MYRNPLDLRLLATGGAADTTAHVTELVLAGWTGSDRATLQQHIDELAKLGVKPPPSVPCFYRVGAGLITLADEIQVVGNDTSGEVEFVLFALPEGLYVGVGSDHTDRKAESYDIALSKQLCFKPIARDLWRFDEVAPHWNSLLLRSYSVQHGHRVLYQEGAVGAMLAPLQLIERYTGGGTLATGTVMFSGTLPAKSGVEGGEMFEIELIDPVRDRELAHSYSVRALPHV